VKVDMKIVDNYLCGAKKGNENDFNLLYSYTKDLLYAYALTIVKDRFAAEDAVQETFAKVYKNLGKYIPGTNGLAWLIHIAKNTAIDEKEKRKAVVITDIGGFRASHENAVVSAVYLDYLLEKLTKQERQTIILRLYGECTAKETAVLLKIPVTTAEWRYKTALKKLKSSLGKDGIYNE